MAGHVELAAREGLIRTSWAVRCAAGEPTAVVRVRNLQTTTQAAQDAWGRNHKTQPLHVSAEVYLSQSFDTAASTDRVSADTVHYGTLSKTILASLEPFSVHTTTPVTLRHVLEQIWSNLTGLYIGGTISSKLARDRPLLDVSKVRFLSVTVFLPKASLLGDGVSLTAAAVFGQEYVFSIALGLQNLRVPTLIGVNSNERLARQVVVANVEIDKFDYAPDDYTGLEAVIVKVLLCDSHLVPTAC